MGVRLGVDPGEVRIGIARCDPSGILATPVETLRRGRGDLDRIRSLAHEEHVVEIVVGLPRSLSGTDGPAAQKARDFANILARRVAPIPVRLCDERLTTVSAQRNLAESGRRGRSTRAVIDQAAAVLILQHALDVERISGGAPGEIVEVSGSGR